MQHSNNHFISKLKILIVLSFSVLFSLAANSQQQDQYVKGQLIVKYKSTLQSAIQRSSGSVGLPAGLKVKKKIKLNQSRTRANTRASSQTPAQGGLEFDVIEIIDKNKSLPRVIKELEDTGLFEYVEPDYTYELNVLPNDPLLPDQWGLDSSHANDPDINAPEAWDITTGNPDLVIAVVDTGIDYNHPDLVNSMWVNSGEIPGDGLDNDGNGVIDDIHGIDARNDDGDPNDQRGHGTHVGGIIAAQGNNAVGVSGVGWNFKLMSVQIFGPSGSAESSDIIEGLQYIHTMNTQYGVNVRIANNSWGGGSFSQALEDTIALLNQENIMFIASAGNNGRDIDQRTYYPANYEFDNVIAVSSRTSTGGTSSFSNLGAVSIDVSAPGSDILSTKSSNGGTSCQTDPEDDGYSLCSGTSMAAPHVSGMAGLLLSQFPNDDVFALRQKLIHSSYSFPTKADEALTYDGMTSVPTGMLITPVYKPVENDGSLSLLPAQITLGALKASPVPWTVRAEEFAWPTPVTPDWITLNAPVNGFVSNSSSVDLNIDIDINDLDYGLHLAQIIATDTSGVEPEIRIPLRVDIKLEPVSWHENILDGGSGDDGMGNSVAIEGDIAVVGAPDYRQNYGGNSYTEHGAVFVFRRAAENNWVLEQKLIPSTRYSNNRFGQSVSISDNKIAIGGHRTDSSSSGIYGHVYVFEYDGNQWVEEQIITHSDGPYADGRGRVFADHVVIKGEHIAVMDFKPLTASPTGILPIERRVFMYRHDGSQWNETAILNQNFELELGFAYDFDLDGQTLAVSAPRSGEFDEIDGVEVYNFENGSWVFGQHLDSAIDSYGFERKNFGDAIALDGNTLITKKHNSYELFEFIKDTNGVWSYNELILHPDASCSIYSCHTDLALADNLLLVGITEADDQDVNSGSAYLYQKTSDGWTFLAKMFAQNPYSYSQLNFGSDVAVSNKYVLVGSWTPDNQLHSYAYLYEIPTEPNLETLTVSNVGSDWVTVNLDNFYDSMVTACSVHYINNSSPVVTRIRNVGLNSFEIKLQNPGDLDAVVADDVNCIVAEEGNWTLPNGQPFEAKRYLSATTSRSGRWSAEATIQSFGNTYSQPILFGQVMSDNDSNWSTFWSQGISRTQPVSAAGFRTGKHVAQDAVQFRADETIGYLVFEAGTSQIGTIDYQVAYTPDTVRHIGHNNNNNLTHQLGVVPDFALVSQSAMDGGDGSWAVLDGFDALSSGQIRIAVDEDQIRDSERNHTTENVGFFISSSPINVQLTSAP